MATPTKEKTWEYDLNNFVLADNTSSNGAYFSTRKRLFQIKEILINNGSTTFTTPWTVVSSSDSSTAGAGDNWTVAADLVWRDDDTSNVFSWIVLRQTGISATFELLITCEEDSINNDGRQIGAWVAQAGFTGGTTTARPTATDERILQNSTSDWWGSGGNDNIARSSQTHVWLSSDGECTRIVIHIGTVPTAYWCFEKPKNPVTPWTDPYFAAIQGTSNVTTYQPTYANFYDTAVCVGRYNGVNTNMYMSGEGFASAAAGENLIAVPNQLTGDWLANAIGLISTTSTFRGRQGEVFDLWWGTNAADDGMGRYFPADASKTFVQIGSLIFPWDGSTTMKTA